MLNSGDIIEVLFHKLNVLLKGIINIVYWQKKLIYIL